MYVSREEMIADLKRSIEHKKEKIEATYGWKRQGTTRRLKIQERLLARVERGEHPTHHEMAGIYGKGARLAY